MTHVLTIPGYQSSGPAHWQTLWEQSDSARFTRVEQRDWDFPEVGEWVAALDDAIADQAEPVVLVAHSLGCITVVRWAVERGVGVRAALLVAPADVERLPDLPLGSFAPIPRVRLPFPSAVVASQDDPYMGFDRAKEFAAAWGSDLVDAGAAGHVNSDSGLGEWAEGRRLLQGLG
ncbi:RBBP9/YdeN family alpha/beta hydrolase [Actinomadura hibisca]|uniref:RBBP9/YdeN family alpha/beta hydrolase n=1 Tax=Actinomadura hibisca TaxID=68565 RepID=UPI00082E6E4E|nr:alpha/beta hydrolase [Actinomadura hibisca]